MKKIIVVFLILLGLSNLLYSDNIINLGRTSISRVYASSVNGNRSMANKFYGVRNLFDKGNNYINKLNYTSWLTDSESKHWVKLKFTENAEVHKVLVEVGNVSDKYSKQSRIPNEFVLKIEYLNDDKNIISKTLDSISIKKFITTYSLPEPIKNVKSVTILFFGERIIEVHEIQVLGKLQTKNVNISVLPQIDIDKEEIIKSGKAYISSHIKNKYSNVTNIAIEKAKKGWIYKIKYKDKDILKIHFDEKGHPIELIDLESDVIKKKKKLESHEKWLQKVLTDIKTIKVGMTRKQLLKVFTTEGGISSSTWRTYVSRDSWCIKVDVNFKALKKDKESPNDTITKISKPYLEWAIID